jgi:hypothetical protein
MTFKERSLRRLCGFWWTFRHGKPNHKFSVPKGGLRPKHLVLILPPEFHDFDVARLVIEPLIDHMNPEQTTVFVRENFRTWLSPDLGLKLVTFDPLVKNWLGFPKPDIYRKLVEIEPDVVLDLTPGFSPYTAALSAMTGAPLRISLDIEQWNDFYNFFIQLDGTKTLAERYEILLRYV